MDDRRVQEQTIEQLQTYLPVINGKVEVTGKELLSVEHVLNRIGIGVGYNLATNNAPPLLTSLSADKVVVGDGELVVVLHTVNAELMDLTCRESLQGDVVQLGVNTTDHVLGTCLYLVRHQDWERRVRDVTLVAHLEEVVLVD